MLFWNVIKQFNAVIKSFYFEIVLIAILMNN